MLKEDEILSVITAMESMVHRTDELNRRLIRNSAIKDIVNGAVIILVVAILAGFYFFADYQYPSTTQETMQNGNEQKVTQQIK